MNISVLLEQAKSGNTSAQSTLGICYLEGIGVKTNYKQAFELLSVAADKGAPRAITNLARMYLNGLGIPRNIEMAIQLFEKAANAGEFLAQIELGRIYSSGVYTEINSDLARKWYATAILQENKVADCEELLEAKIYLKEYE